MGIVWCMCWKLCHLMVAWGSAATQRHTLLPPPSWRCVQIQMEDLKHSVGSRAVKSASSDTTHTFYASSSKLYKS